MTESKIWVQPPQSLKIETGEVHVWRAELDRSDTAVQELRETLDTEEMDRAKRFHFERHRRDFIVGRGLLRRLLGSYLGVEPAALKFSYGPYGKPALEGLDQLRFNMSHSRGIALYAFSEELDIGVDVEHIRADFASEDIARRFFSAVEVTNLCALSGEEQVEAFFRCWTRKEAFIKVTGRGLSQSLDGFDVTLAPSVPAALLRVGDDEAERWELFDVEVGEGYAGALAVQGKVSRIRYWEFK
jgi:4'-phosphopantetheinyl transferase